MRIDDEEELSPFELAARHMREGADTPVAPEGGMIEDEVSPFEIAEREQNALRRSLEYAVTQEPDRAAEIVRLSLETGISPGAVDTHLDELQRRERRARMEGAVQGSPLLKQWMTADPAFSSVAQDDVGVLATIEEIGGYLTRAGRSVAAALPSFNAGMWGAARAGAETISATAGPLIRQILPEDPAARAAEFFKQRQQEQAQVAEVWTGDLSRRGAVERSVLSGLQSAGQTMLTLPAAILTGNPAVTLGAMSAVTGGQSYAEARDKNLSVAQALAYGTSQGMIEAATEMLPVSRLLSDLGKHTGVFKTLLGQLAAEIPGEQVATVLQDANSWAMLNPQGTVGEYLAARPSRAAETLIATVAAVGAVTGTGKAVQAAAERMGAKDAALSDAMTLSDMAKAAAESKLRERDPEVFRKFVKDATDDTDVFVSATAFAQSAQEGGIDLQQLLAAVPALREQFMDALTSGADLQIPVADLMTHIAPDLPGIVDHLRTSPEAMSRAEAREYLQSDRGQQLGEEVDQFSAEMDAATARDSAQAQAAETLKSRIAESLVRDGKMRHDQAEQNAAIMAAFYSTQAERFGMSVEQFEAVQPLPGITRRLTDGYRQGERGAFNPDANTIALFANADLSTFAHESGHFYLESIANLASRDDAGQQIKADVDTVMQWFGTTREAWAGMTLEQRRESHEKFARGFEAYLFEGKAPSAELQSVFRRFAAWMKQVYRTLKGLNVELSDEVRAVMDRMLATDEQIAATTAAREQAPLFDESLAAELGMSPEEFRAYQTTNRQAADEASETLARRGLRDMAFVRNMKNREIKRLQAEQAENRKAVEAEVTAEVMAEPVFRARAAIQASDVKLDIDGMKAFYGDAPAAPWRYLPTGRRGLAGKNGTNPDLVAEQFGFESGDQLVRALVEAGDPKQHIEALTDARMLERYGELTTPDGIERAAEEAIANDARTRMVATEAQVLDRAQGNKPLLMRAARAHAAGVIDRQQVRKLRPSNYTRAEAKAGRAVQEAMAASNTRLAAAHARERVLAHALGRAAVEARAQAEKQRAFLAGFARPGTRDAIDPDYRDQIDALLERVDLKPRATEKELARRESLGDWIAKQEAQGLTPDIDTQLLERSQAKHYSEMTVAELRALTDAVKNIEHLGRLKKKLLTARDDREFGARIEEAIASITANATKTLPRELTAPGDTVQWLRSFRAEHRKFSSLVRQMDGGQDGGVVWELLSRAMNEAGDRETTMREEATLRLAEILQPVLKLKGGLAGDRRHIPEVQASLSRGERLAVALNLGNEGNRQRLLSGHAWTAEQVEAITKTLTRAEWNAVQSIWDFVNSYWPEIAAKQRRVTGTEPEKVEATPFPAVTAEGEQIVLRGGYYPIKADPRLSDRASSNEAAEVAKDMLRGAYSRSTTRRGHTKARAESSSQPLQLDLGVLFSHVNQVVHDLTHHEWLIDATRIFNDKGFTEAVRRHYGPDLLKTMKDQLSSIAAGDLPASMSADRLLNALRNRTSAAVMGWSLTTALLQPFGLSQSIVRIGARHVAAGVGEVFRDAASLESSIRKIGERSEFMRLRAKTMNREMHEIKNRVRRGQSKFGAAFDTSLFLIMQKMQLVADVPTWLGAHQKALAEGNDEARAVALADQAVIDAQGSGMTKDLAQIQQGGSGQRILTMFYSYFSTTYNLTAESWARLDPKLARSIGGFMADLALLYVIPALGPWLVLAALRGGGDDDEDPAEWAFNAAKQLGGFMLGTVVGLRELSGLVAGFDTYSGPPAFRLIAGAYKSAKQVGQGEVDEAAVRAISQTAGTALGLPVTQVDRMYRGWQAWEEGDAGPGAILLGPPLKE